MLAVTTIYHMHIWSQKVNAHDGWTKDRFVQTFHQAKFQNRHLMSAILTDFFFR